MNYQRIFDSRNEAVQQTNNRRFRYEAFQEERARRQSHRAQRMTGLSRGLLNFIIFLALFLAILTAFGFALSQLSQPVAPLPAASIVGPTGRVPYVRENGMHARAQPPTKRVSDDEQMIELAR